MPGGEQIPLTKAAEVLAYRDLGYSERQIGRFVDIGNVSVHGIINGHGRWGEKLVERPLLERLRAEQNQILEQAWRTGAAKAISKAFTDEKMDKASFLQLTTGACQAIDKALLLSGSPTQIIGHIQDRRSVESLEALAAALSQTLIARQSGSKDLENLSTSTTEAQIIK